MLILQYFVLNTFSSLVLKPTGVTEKSKAFIDNIFFNSFEFTRISGNTDRYMTMLLNLLFWKPLPPRKSNTYKRILKSLIGIK